MGPSGDVSKLQTERLKELTPELREVFDLQVKGLPRKQMAAQLNIPENTLKSRLKRLNDVLGTKGKAELIALAAKLGPPETQE